jgi:small GTP-binding protein
LKCVVVGDGNVGKTSLMMSYTSNVFSNEYIPTVFDNYTTNLIVEDVPIKLQIWDTAGQTEYGQFRHLAYPETDIFLICFSIGCQESFRNVQTLWVQELIKHCPTTPYLLIGLKSDLRNNDSCIYKRDKMKIVEPWMGEQMNEDINARMYIECSALNHYNVNYVFEEAVRAVLYPESDVTYFNDEVRGNCCEIA